MVWGGVGLVLGWSGGGVGVGLVWCSGGVGRCGRAHGGRCAVTGSGRSCTSLIQYVRGPLADTIFSIRSLQKSDQ